jgi:hypothetical protein
MTNAHSPYWSGVMNLRKIVITRYRLSKELPLLVSQEGAQDFEEEMEIESIIFKRTEIRNKFIVAMRDKNR